MMSRGQLGEPRIEQESPQPTLSFGSLKSSREGYPRLWEGAQLRQDWLTDGNMTVNGGPKEGDGHLADA